MKIYVCVKHVPDTAANIKIAGANGFDDANCKFIINPYDEYAIEQAVRLTESQGGEAVVVTVGKASAMATVRSALAMGPLRGILVTIEDQFLDSEVTSQALKAAIEKDGRPDLIFAGKGAVDTEGFQTAYRLAEAMQLPVVNEILKMELRDGKAVVEREGLNEPRYPKFPDIMKAKKKEVKQMTLADLGLSAAAAQTERVQLEKVPDRTAAKILPGPAREATRELVRILKEVEKLI